MYVKSAIIRPRHDFNKMSQNCETEEFYVMYGMCETKNDLKLFPAD